MSSIPGRQLRDLRVARDRSSLHDENSTYLHVYVTFYAADPTITGCFSDAVRTRAKRKDL